MDWRAFLGSLFEDGRLDVPAFAPLSTDDLAELRECLTPYEAVARLNFPAGAPTWDPEAGSWAAAMLLRASQFAVYRDLGEATIHHQLSGDGPESSPSTHYSVDLCFRYLPDVLSFARSASEDDPLVKQMLVWAEQWPLSSVGTEGVSITKERLDAILSCPALRQTYVDRILSADDASRLDMPTVLQAVRATVGAHDDLAPPRIHRRLEADSATQRNADDTLQ